MSEEHHPSQYPEWQDYVETASSLPYVDTPSQRSSASPPPQSASRPAQQPAIRTEIDQLLAIHRLGKVRREYKNEVSTTLAGGLSSCMLGVLCFLPLILLWFTQVGIIFSGLRWTFIIGFGLLGYGINRVTVAINNIGANMLYHNPRCYLCAHGVMSIKGKQVQAIRWDQIRCVQKIFPTGISDIPQQYILYPPGDEALVLDRVFTGFGILGKQIEREVARHLLPEILAAYKAGQTLNFGAVNVTPQGLSLEGRQKDLPWEKLGAIDEHRGYLIIKERGTLSTWEHIEVSTMLNLYVLLLLIRQIKHENRIRGNGQRSVSYQPPVNDPLQRSEWREYE